MAQWRPILDWLAPLVQPEAKQAQACVPASLATAPRTERAPTQVAAAAPSRATDAPTVGSPRTVPATAAPAAIVAARPSSAVARALTAVTGGGQRVATPVGRLLDALAIPRFLQRNS
jgi:nucleoid-associated protein YgaU